MPQYALEAVLTRAISQQIMPGTVIAYHDDQATWTRVFGHVTYDDASPEVIADTIYDLASLTKVFTNTLALVMLDQGRLSLESRLVDHIPDVDPTRLGEVTIRHLLTYTATANTAGKSPSKMTHAELRGIIELSNHAPLLYPAGTKFIYSSITSMWLSLVIESVYGERFDKIVERELLRPLGMDSTSFHPPTQPGLVAPSEIDARGEVVTEPHDETAWVLQREGVYLGHAGLFSTAEDLMKLARLYLDEGVTQAGQRLLSPEIVRSSYADHQFPGVVPPNGLGWWLEMDQYFDRPIGTKTYGMTGFTGGMMLIDPERRRALVMLSNRTYPHRPGTTRAINDLRAEVAGLLLNTKR